MKKRYFAQLDNCDPKVHKSKHFVLAEDGINWLLENGDGVLKRKSKKFGYFEDSFVKNGSITKAKDVTFQLRDSADELCMTLDNYLSIFK
jgi:hypothetical protein